MSDPTTDRVDDVPVDYLDSTNAHEPG